jgi:N4-gp56 family major capsid protein
MALSVNHPSARRFWSMNLSKSVSQTGFFHEIGLMKAKGEGDEGAVVVKMDVEQGSPKSGYQVDYDLEGPLLIKPTSGDNPIKGKESRLTLFNDFIQINQDRVSVIDDGKFADGLVPYEFRNRVKERLATEQWPTYFDERIIAKASGALGDGVYDTIDTAQPVTGARNKDGSVASDGNDLRGPSTSRIIYGAAKANQAALTTGDLLSLDVIDAAVLKAVRPQANATLKRVMKPLIINGERVFVLLVDYVTLTAMKAAMAGRYYDLEKAKLQGGLKSSPLMNYADCVYVTNGIKVILVPHPKLVKFSAATTGSVKADRNLLLGQGALRIAYGRDAKDMPNFDWHEETDDRGNQLVVTSGTTVGIQKTAFRTTETGTTREDWGVIAIDTYGDW